MISLDVDVGAFRSVPRVEVDRGEVSILAEEVPASFEIRRR